MEKLIEVDWHKHLHHSDSLWINFAIQTLDVVGKFERKLNRCGAMGLSGTGSKAGGPHYLISFSIEQTVITNKTDLNDV